MMNRPARLMSSILEEAEEDEENPEMTDQNSVYQTEFDPLIVSLIEERDQLHETINQLSANNTASLEKINRLSATVDEMRDVLSQNCRGNEVSLLIECVKLRVDRTSLLKEREYFHSERRNIRFVLDQIEAYLCSDKHLPASDQPIELVTALKSLFDDRGDSSDNKLKAKFAQERVSAMEKEVEALNQEIFSLREEMLTERDSIEQRLRDELDQARKIENHLRKRCLHLSNKLCNSSPNNSPQNEKQSVEKDCSSSPSSEGQNLKVFQDEIVTKRNKRNSFFALSRRMSFKFPILRKAKNANKLVNSSTVDKSLLSSSHNLQRKLKLVKNAIRDRKPLDKWKSDIVHVWLTNWIGFPPTVLTPLSHADGNFLFSITDAKLLKLFPNPFHRLKIVNAVAELNEYMALSVPPSESIEGLLNHQWVCDVWLPHIGLPQYAPLFRYNLVDSRMLASIRQDSQLLSNLSVPSKLHRRSIYFSITVLDSIVYSRVRLEEMASSPFQEIPLEFWTANNVASWLASEGFGKHVPFLMQKGLNGAILAHDTEFTFHNLRQLLQIDTNGTLSEKLRKSFQSVRSTCSVRLR